MEDEDGLLETLQDALVQGLDQNDGDWMATLPSGKEISFRPCGGTISVLLFDEETGEEKEHIFHVTLRRDGEDY